jgi:hypothetical protein
MQTSRSNSLIRLDSLNRRLSRRLKSQEGVWTGEGEGEEDDDEEEEDDDEEMEEEDEGNNSWYS